MKTYKTILTALIIFTIAACGGSQTSESTESDNSAADIKSMYPDEDEDAAQIDAGKGVGKFKDVSLAENLDHSKAALGKEVYALKCEACHRLEGDRLVGPSWKGVTEKRDPAWILNFITNVDEMLDKDPVAMAQFEECLIRMPNQNLTDEDAFAVLEYMRQNDGVK